METDKLFLKEKQGYKMRTMLLIYTALFVVTALGVYLVFLVDGKTFLTAAKSGNKDGVSQIYTSYVAVKHIIQALLSGNGFDEWNWSIGLGSDNWNMFVNKLANPFTYIIIAFPEKYIDLGYTIVAVLRQYFVGVSFLYLGRRAGLTQKQNLMGAMCYAFSMWVLLTAMAQSGFDNAAILFPLLILGCEKIYHGESPLLFVVSVFFLLSAGVIWAYSSGLMIITYLLIRLLLDEGKKGQFADKLRIFGKVFLNGVVGILLGSAFVVSILMSMTSATTDTGSGKEVLFTLRDYLSVPTALFKAAGTGAESYSAIGLPIIGVVLMPMTLLGIKKKRPEAILAVLCYIGTQIPFVCRVFNGFSYASGRWFYIPVLFMAWATAEMFTEETFKSLKKCILMEVVLAVLSGWCILKYVALDMADNKTGFLAAMGLGFGTLIIAICYFKANNIGSGKLIGLVKNNAYVLLMMIVVVDIVGIAFVHTYGNGHEKVDGYSAYGEIYDRISETAESAVAELQDADADFYRSDQVEGYYGIRSSGARVNENIFFGNRSVYTCFSSAQSSWHEYNKVVGNCAGNYRRTLINSNDGRAMLDYLLGVKYFIGSSSATDTESNASDYLPYGYSDNGVVNGYETYINNHCMGLGTVYDKYITESELMEYPTVFREQVLMQVAVVPDDYIDALKNVEHAQKKDIEIVGDKLSYTCKSSKGIELNKTEKSIKVTDTEACLTFDIDEVENAQIYISFEGLIRKENSYDEEMLMEGTVTSKENESFNDKVIRASYKDDQGFKIIVKKDDIKKAAVCEKGGVRSFNDLEDYDINLGYYESIEGEIEVRIDNLGNYTYDAIKIYAVPMENYDKQAEILDENSYKISEWNSDELTGEIEAKENGIMYFSILKNKGWKIYVDGEEQEKIEDVNISFIGAEISKGTHTVELKYEYPYKEVIIIATLFGVLLLAAELIYYRKKRHE